jgi:hypothetical protein
MLIYLLIFVLVFLLLRWDKGIPYIVIIDICFQVFTGNLNESFNLFLEPSDWVVLIIFINTSIYSISKRKAYAVRFNWVDRLILFYFIIVLFIPGLVNYFGFDVLMSFKYFIPIRFWLVYRNYYNLMRENSFRKRKMSINFILNTLIFFGVISAIISISRFFSFPVLSKMEDIWPIYYGENQVTMAAWGRLSGTMSSTNGTGNYFCFLTAISLTKFNLKNWKVIICLFIFLMSVILSGSFSSIAALGFVLFLNVKKKILALKTSVFLVIICIGVFFTINETDVFKNKLQYRIETGYLGEKKTGILPSNLVNRIGYWSTFAKILISDQRIYFGLGPGGFFNYEYGKNSVVNQNAESFYFRILNESGIFALLYVMFFFICLYKRNQRKVISLTSSKYQFLLKQVIVILLVAGVANETLYYGANTSLFGIFLAILDYLSAVSRQKKFKSEKQHYKTRVNGLSIIRTRNKLGSFCI